MLTSKEREDSYISGTKVGGAKAAQTNKAKYGDDFYKRIGSEGGKKGTGHAFGHGKVDPHIAGAKGGRISRRTSLKAGTLIEEKKSFFKKLFV